MIASLSSNRLLTTFSSKTLNSIVALHIVDFLWSKDVGMYYLLNLRTIIR